MPRLTKLYTRKGDDGSTALGSGRRIQKDALRVCCYGTVDEANSALGVALAHGLSPRLIEMVSVIQNELFHVGSDLCFTEEDKHTVQIPQIGKTQVKRLESWIDELNATVGPLANFILPGGSTGSAHLHLARTICRRAEREVTTLKRQEPIGAFVLPYLNRLSDLLFVMARFENKERGVPEPLWDSRL